MLPSAISTITHRLVPPPAVDIAPLALFRIAFGALMAVEMARFFAHGWVRALFVEPPFHFTYPGLGWVRPWPGDGMVWQFGLLLACAVLVALGVYYRAAMLLFALGFTHAFLVDAAFYQNHFYLICLLAWLMVFVPADRAWSVDAALGSAPRSDAAPGWTVWLLRAQLAIVYAFAGLAKLNPDWLRGEPVRTFLANGPDLGLAGPLLDPLLHHPAAPWIISYGGLALDLAIVPLLLWPRTRAPALVAAVAFHLTNAALFPIGIFPWLMIAALPLLLPPEWSRKAVEIVARRVNSRQRRQSRTSPAAEATSPTAPADDEPSPLPQPFWGRGRGWGPISRLPYMHPATLTLLLLQLVLPLRHLAYPGNVSWTGEGELFAWRMMLDLKEGTTTFVATDPADGRSWDIDPQSTLADWQYRKMAIRPDLILQFAHHLRDTLAGEGRRGVEIRARASMALNGRPQGVLVDPAVDLARVRWSWRSAGWIVPLLAGDGDR